MSVKRLVKNPKNQFGDTIVEVMVVLAVLGFAIGISYATANRSLLNARQAQENSQAAALVQSQVEALRAMAANDSTEPDYIYSPGTFCVGANGHKATAATDCNLGEASRYSVTITLSGGDTFSIKAVWDDVLGQGQDSVTLLYRVHPS